MFTKAALVGISLSFFTAFVCPQAMLAEDVQYVSKINNFEQVTPLLCRGAQPSAADLKELAGHGVKTIVDLRDINCGREEKSANSLGLHYVHIPLLFTTPDPQKVQKFLSIVNDPANGQVFVHCRQGADRTGMLCAIYRITVQKWTFDQAWDEMRTHHFKPWLTAMKGTVKSFAQTETAKTDTAVTVKTDTANSDTVKSDSAKTSPPVSTSAVISQS